MNKEQVIEANKLIAEFMGGKPYRVMVKSIGMMDAYQWGENGYTIDELQYHSNWNMLMPVVIKIFQLKNIEGLYKQLNQLTEAYMLMDLKYIHKAVIQFIQWYNQTNQQ